MECRADQQRGMEARGERGEGEYLGSASEGKEGEDAITRVPHRLARLLSHYFPTCHTSQQRHAVHTYSHSTLPRGMQCTMYVKMAPGVTVDQLRAHLATTYASEPFVKVWGLCGAAGC